MLKRWHSRTFARGTLSGLIVAVVLGLVVATGSVAAAGLTVSPTVVKFAPPAIEGQMPSAPPHTIPPIPATADRVPLVRVVGTVGEVFGGEGDCEPGRIWTKPPVIIPSFTNSLVWGAYLPIGGSQWIGFREHLYVWDGGPTWLLAGSGSWKGKEENIQQGDPSYDWYYDWGTKTWGTGGRTFPITRKGFYALWFEYYWFGTANVGWGSAEGAGALAEFRYGAYNWGDLKMCRYPY